MNHYIFMFFAMILSGLLTTMNVWADKLDDIRFSLNDIYMVLLMTGWMFFFMGLMYQERGVFLFGLTLVALFFTCIRTQFMVTSKQYALGMIPHHSMAVLMSKRAIKNGADPFTREFARNVIIQQENEIKLLKSGRSSYDF